MRTTRLWRLRRAAWRVRRSGPRLARPLSAVLPPFAPPSQPVLLLGCPRAGTSILLDALLRGTALRSVQSEGHVLWDEFHHPRDHGWESDALGAHDVGRREREYIYAAVRLFARGRFVDKTPESCLRIAYLDALFPDARFVFLRRRAAGNVNSLIEGWRARPRFVTYRLPGTLEGIGPLSGNRWSFVLVPGWRELRQAPLEEICARQYIACNESVLAAREQIDPDRWIDVAYEDLVADPAVQLERLFDLIGVRFGEETRAFAASLPGTPSATALTPPRPEKWREQNPDAVARILPLVRATEIRLGYEPA